MVFVIDTHATSHATVLAQCVAATETNHCIFVFAAFRKVAQIFSDGLESIATIEVIAVDHAERLLDDILTHQHCMVRTPRFLTTFWALETFRESIDALEAKLTRNSALIFGKNLCAELLFEILADDPDDFSESCLNGIINTIIHDSLAVWAQTIKLLQTTISASHTSSQEK